MLTTFFREIQRQILCVFVTSNWEKINRKHTRPSNIRKTFHEVSNWYEGHLLDRPLVFRAKETSRSCWDVKFPSISDQRKWVFSEFLNNLSIFWLCFFFWLREEIHKLHDKLGKVQLNRGNFWKTWKLPPLSQNQNFRSTSLRQDAKAIDNRTKLLNFREVIYLASLRFRRRQRRWEERMLDNNHPDRFSRGGEDRQELWRGRWRWQLRRSSSERKNFLFFRELFPPWISEMLIKSSENRASGSDF